MRICKLLISIVPLAALTMLAGCTVIPTRAQLTPKNECIELAQKTCPNERFSFVSKEKVKADLPTEIYHFKSDERDLEFEVESTYGHMYFGRMPISWAYKPSTSCNYAEKVKALYRDELAELFENVPCHKEKKLGYAFVIETPEDVDDVVDAVYKANELYAKELEYNDEKWLSKNQLELVDAYFSCNPYDPKQYVYEVKSFEDGATYAHFTIEGIDSKEDIAREINEKIDSYYGLDTYSVNLGDKTIEKQFPRAYNCKKQDDYIDGTIRTTQAHFYCSNSNILVQQDTDIESEISEIIESELEEKNRNKKEPEKIEDFKLNEYEKDGRKCYSVKYDVAWYPYGERNRAHYVELYENVGAQFYYRVWFLTNADSLNVEDIINYFGV